MNLYNLWFLKKNKMCGLSDHLCHFDFYTLCFWKFIK